MSRPKKAEQEQFRHLIRVRVNDAVYERLTKLQKQTDCRSICEMARKILSGERINVFHREASLNGPMEELALIRKELKAIGININQQTHHFHLSENSNERAFYSSKTATLYKGVDNKVDQLLLIVTKLAEKWLPK
jgi:hypothetical protein